MTESLQKQIEQLDREMVPKRDLWPGIEQAIASQPRFAPQRANPWLKVAAGFAPIALVAGLVWQMYAQQTPVYNPVVAAYSAQKQKLLQVASHQQPLISNFDESYAELEQAEKSLIKALQNQPEDPALLKMLSQVYMQQIELIEKAHKPAFDYKVQQI